MTSAHAATSATGPTSRPAAFAFARPLLAGAQADLHVDAALLQVQRVGVALRAVADDGDLLAADEGEVGVLS